MDGNDTPGTTDGEILGPFSDSPPPGAALPRFPAAVPGIDLSAALKYLGGSEDLVICFLHEFVRDFGSASEQMECHMQAEDLGAILFLSHSIKSVAAYAGAAELASAAGELELAARNGRSKEIPGAADKFVHHLAIVLTSIRTHFPVPEREPGLGGR